MKRAPPEDEGIAADTAPPAPAARGLFSVAGFTQLAAFVDLCCLFLSGGLWLGATKVSMAFSPLEAHLLALGLTIISWAAMLGLAPFRLGRLLDMPWAIADAFLVPVFVGAVVTIPIAVLLGSDSASAILLWPFASMTTLVPSRILVSGLARRGVRAGWLRRRIAIVGATDISTVLIQRLLEPENPETPDIVGIFDDRDATRRPPEVAGVPVQGNIKDLCNFAGRERLDLIVIALPLSRAIDILRSVQQVQWLTAEVVVLLDGVNHVPQGTNHSIIAGQPVLQLVRQPIAAGGMLAKSLFDSMLAAIALILLSPLLAIAAIAIRLEGAGPILFRQPRIGRNGRIFHILKLRTLSWDPQDSGQRGVLAGDQRITRVGRILRPMCIDELPQLINVLRGEMSMVGPRPHVAHMLVAGQPIEQLVPGYGARHRMKPGITGWAQVNGLSGTMMDVAMACSVVAHDLAYLSEWSFWLDLRILARTAVVSLFGRKAFEAESHQWRGL